MAIRTHQTNLYFYVWILIFFEITLCGYIVPVFSSELSKDHSESIHSDNKYLDNSGALTSRLRLPRNAEKSPSNISLSFETKESSSSNTIHKTSEVAPLHETMIIGAKRPDKNYNTSLQLQATLENEAKEFDAEDDHRSATDGNQGTTQKFDEKAIQRGLLVTAGLAGLIVIYFGVKFIYLKEKKRKDKRYGRIESERDLLEEIEIESEEEDDTLFDVNTTSRSHL